MKEKKFPKLPGVYFFKNAQDDILYIGKAKNLHDRIMSYLQGQDEREMVAHLVKEATTIDTIITSNETEALYLEAHLVKEFQPKYNTLLKEGDPFLYIVITQGKLPALDVTRRKDKKGYYFGPFLQRQQARKVFDYLIKTFALKLCKKKIDNGCLDFHIGVCAGVCRKDFDVEFYKQKIELVRQLLDNNLQDATKILQSEIDKASAQMLFERARNLHGYLQNIESILYTVRSLEKAKTNLVYSSEHIKSNIALLTKLKERLGLRRIPYTIDCFDISHLSGTCIVGSCIRFTDGRPDKQKFRRFQIKTLQDQNDYAALQEIVSRRYRDTSMLPDFIVIDGGKGQLNAVKDLVGDTEIVGLAKREETIIFVDGREIKLDIQKEEDRVLLELRDYTHHFAITYHRKKRTLLDKTEQGS
jgi:excinuclease ABC subunit C